MFDFYNKSARIVKVEIEVKSPGDWQQIKEKIWDKQEWAEVIGYGIREILNYIME